VRQKKVSCEKKRPVDSDSWGAIKQPYIGGFQDQFVGVSFPKTFCTLKSRFSPFKNCFWRKEWRENSEKNSTPSSYSDLPIELVHVAIGALTGLKSRFL